jgi:large subunit ribosomal protein L9
MKVVFIEEVPGTAKIGDIKDVKPGFARNYLLPRRMALIASANVIKTVEIRAARETRLQEARDGDARALAEKLDGVTYVINAKAGSTGKLFGSVGSGDVAAKVGETLGTEFDRHNIPLDPIKDLGDYPVVVKLTKNVSATVTVSVVGEDGTTAADIAAKKEGVSTKERGSRADDDASDDDGESPSTDEIVDAIAEDASDVAAEAETSSDDA